MRVATVLGLVTFVTAVGSGGAAQLDSSSKPVRRTFSPPQFLSLFNHRIAERIGIGAYWQEVTTTCSVQVEYERLRVEAETAGPPFWASRDMFANDEAGMRAWQASPLGASYRQASEAFQRAQEAYADCLSTSRALTWRLPVYSEPSTSSKRVGVILGHVTPTRDWRQITFTYEPANGLPTQPFPLDDHQDSDYFPVYAHSVLEQRGDWFLLPRRPFPRSVWVNLKDLDVEPEIGLPEYFAFARAVTGTALATGRPSTVPVDMSFTIVERRRGTFLIREETDADRACPSDDDDPVNPEARVDAVPTRPLQFLVEQQALVDRDRHLIISETFASLCD